MKISTITVIGAGTMGNGIAHVFALLDYQVVLCDSNLLGLEKGITTIKNNLSRQVSKGKITQEERDKALSNITTSSVLQEAVLDSDLVIEAISELLDVKLNLFRDLDKYCKPSCILASNTSSISITKLASATQRPTQVIGMHFMNPVPLMPLVEVIRGYATSKTTTETIVALSKAIGKTPIEANDYPGFVSNRILMPMINEAIYTLFEGVAGVEEIDQVMKLGMAHPMGPLELADYIGLDVCMYILQVLHAGFGNPKYAPCPLLVNMVETGYKGCKTGEGFYSYDSNSKDKKVAPRFTQ